MDLVKDILFDILSIVCVVMIIILMLYVIAERITHASKAVKYLIKFKSEANKYGWFVNNRKKLYRNRC